MKKKIKILFWGDGVAQTGFSRVLHSIAEYLPKTLYDISWLAVNYYGDPHDYPYRIYPASTGGDVYGIGRIAQVIKIEKPDLLFILNDIWIISEFLKKVEKEVSKELMPKIVTYFPVDALFHDPDWYAELHNTTPVVYTDFGLQVATQARNDLKYHVITHGVDTDKFYKLDIPKSELKKKIGINIDSYEDSFVVLNANRNQPRKKLQITMEAFTLFSQDKPDNVKLYMHCGIQDSALDIIKLSRRYGIEDRLIISNLNPGAQQLTIRKLNEIYNASDIGVNTSLGEGFGLVSVEHAVTGAPQIVPDHSACRELFADCGLLVPVAVPMLMDQIQTVGGLVSPASVAKEMQALYTYKQLYNSLSEKGIRKFSSEDYSWKSISRKWDALFREVMDGNTLADEHNGSDQRD